MTDDQKRELRRLIEAYVNYTRPPSDDESAWDFDKDYDSDIVETHEPLVNFTGKAGVTVEHTESGLVVVEGFQYMKGTPRVTLYIKDFGNFLGILEQR